MKPTILGRSDTEKLSVLYADAFSRDELLMKTYKLRPRELSGFFRALHRLFFSGKPVKAIGLEENGELLAATTLIHSNFRAGTKEMFSAIRRSIQELGWLRARWFWFINFYQGILSAPKKHCWRLLFIGTRSDLVGRGLGRALLEETFRSLPDEPIQLEVEAVNPAGRLYERMGFREERRFNLRGVEWRVMIREPKM